MDLREKQGGQRYKKLREAYNKLQSENKTLLKTCKKQEEMIKRLKLQLANGKVIIARKEAQNRRNLKRLSKKKNSLKRKTRYVSKTTTEHLSLVQHKLAQERAKGRELVDELHQKDAEFCELEERYKEVQAEVDEFIEGTKKYVPNTMEEHKFTNEIRELYYRLLAENLSPGKIGKSIKIVLEAFCPRIDTEKLKLPKKRLAT